MCQLYNVIITDKLFFIPQHTVPLDLIHVCISTVYKKQSWNGSSEISCIASRERATLVITAKVL